MKILIPKSLNFKLYFEGWSSLNFSLVSSNKLAGLISLCKIGGLLRWRSIKASQRSSAILKIYLGFNFTFSLWINFPKSVPSIKLVIIQGCLSILIP